MNAAWFRFELSRAVFGALVCMNCGVLECAPYGRKPLGSTTAQFRRFVRRLRREQWQRIARVHCPKCERLADRGARAH